MSETESVYSRGLLNGSRLATFDNYPCVFLIIILLYFYQGYSLYFFLTYDNLGFRFWGQSFYLVGFGTCGVGPSGFFGMGGLHIDVEE